MPVRAEDPGLAIVELGAISPLADALSNRGASAGAEQIVIAERDEAAKAFLGGVAGAELEAPGLRLAHDHLDVPDGRGRVTERLDVHAVEEARGIEAAAGFGERDGRERIARRELKLALHDVRLGGRQARDHDLADPRELAFLHGIARRDRPVLVGRAQAHRRTSVSAPLIELLHLVPRLLGTGRVPGIARTESDRLVNRLGVEDAVAGDGDRGDHSPRALDDRAEGHARGADLRRREPLRAVILAKQTHVLLEALLDEETAEDADRDQPGGPRLHLLGQLLGGERREPFEGDALDDDARALGDLELHDALAGVAAERSGHLHEVVTRLVIAPLDLIGARPHLDLVDDPVVGKDQPLAKYGLGERLPPHELHTGQRALGDLQLLGR